MQYDNQDNDEYDVIKGQTENQKPVSLWLPDVNDEDEYWTSTWELKKWDSGQIPIDAMRALERYIVDELNLPHLEIEYDRYWVLNDPKNVEFETWMDNPTAGPDGSVLIKDVAQVELRDGTWIVNIATDPRVSA